MFRFLFYVIFLGGVALLLYLLWGGEVNWNKLKFWENETEQVVLVNNSSDDLFATADEALAGAGLMSVDNPAEKNTMVQPMDNVEPEAEVVEAINGRVDDILVSVEILDDRVILTKKGDDSFRQVISNTKVKNPKLKNGVFSFYEKTPTGWSFKAIHLNAFLDRN